MTPIVIRLTMINHKEIIIKMKNKECKYVTSMLVIMIHKQQEAKLNCKDNVIKQSIICIIYFKTAIEFPFCNYLNFKMNISLVRWFEI